MQSWLILSSNDKPYSYIQRPRRRRSLLPASTPALLRRGSSRCHQCIFLACTRLRLALFLHILTLAGAFRLARKCRRIATNNECMFPPPPPGLFPGVFTTARLVDFLS